ncbi:MAG: hypothetical protein R3A44_15385, partial [Caldilineaceae bacterium]
IAQRLRHMLLPDDFIKCLAAPLAVERLGHSVNLVVCTYYVRQIQNNSQIIFDDALSKKDGPQLTPLH